MNSMELDRLLQGYERAQLELEVSRLQIWEAFAAADPGLAAEIVMLFSSVPSACTWALTNLPSLGISPARAVAIGRGEEIHALVQRTLHGFVG